MNMEIIKKDTDSFVELAIPHINSQAMTDIYDLQKGLMAGTIFPELDMPFYMGGAKIER